MNLSEFTSLYGLKLNDSQTAAVTARGNTLLLAVPGSGKTTAIIARVGYLIRCLNVPTSEILTITYTTSAANDMNQRFANTFSDIPPPPKFCTINSFCLSVMHMAERRYAMHIPELMKDNSSIIRKIYTEMTSDYPSEGVVRTISSGITYVMNMTGCGKDEKELCSQIRIPKLSFYEIYQRYKKYKSQNDLMDFDDQLLMAYSVLTGLGDILESVTSRYKYINVDEAQDTSFIQHRIIKLISEKNAELFMVGDEDQSIYGFRAAYPQALLNFKREYKNARILLMETNYRSTGSIISAANKFIGKNKNRQKKQMRTENEVGATVKRIHCTTFAKQGEFVARYLKALDEPKTVAVLFRNNDSAVPFMYFFEKYGVEYMTKDSSSVFFTSFIIKDIMSMLVFSLDLDNIDVFSRFCYKLGLYITKDEYTRAVELSKKKSCDILTALSSLKNDERYKKRIVSVCKTFVKLKKSNPYIAIQLILDDLDYEKQIKHAVKEGYSEDVLRHKLAVLLAIAENEPTIESFIGKMSDIAHGRANYRRQGAKITLSTIHSSKGLEFDEVIIADAIEGILPAEHSEDDALEEERRLFYVAVTRARSELGFLVPEYINGKRAKQSPFVISFVGRIEEKIKEEKTEKGQMKAKYAPEDFAEGSLIRHKVFGDGVIKTIDGDVITAEFFTRGEKKLGLTICIAMGYIELV